MRVPGFSVVVAPALVLLMAGCGAPQEESAAPATDSGAGEPVTINSCGREVTFETPPERILAVGAEAPSLLVAAGAGDKVTHYSGTLDVPFDEQTQAVVEGAEQVIEDSHELSFELIVDSGVDTLIGTDIGAGVDINALADRLEQAGVQLVTVNNYCQGIEGRTTDGASGYDLIYDDVEKYGRLFGTEDVAGQAVQGMRDRVSAAVEQVSADGSRSAAALYVPAEGTLGAYGGASLASEQMELLGLTNVFADLDERYFEPSTEELVGADPDVVLGIYLPINASSLERDEDVAPTLSGRPDLAGLQALDNADGVVPLNYYYTAAGPLAVDGLELLADRLAEVS